MGMARLSLREMCDQSPQGRRCGAVAEGAGLAAAADGTEILEFPVEEIVRRLPMDKARELIQRPSFQKMCRPSPSFPYTGARLLPRPDEINKMFEGCASERERKELSTALTLIGCELYRGHRTCDRCLNFERQCICHQVPRETFAHRIWLYQHATEYRRMPNSGKLMLLVCPDETKCRRVIAGVNEQEAGLLESIRASPETSVALLARYPRGHKHMTLADFRLQQYKMYGPAVAEKALNIVVLDGSKTEVTESEKRLARFGAKLPAIGLPRRARQSWISELPGSMSPEETCTSQAVAETLRQLGDINSYKALLKATQCLIESRFQQVVA